MYFHWHKRQQRYFITECPEWWMFYQYRYHRRIHTAQEISRWYRDLEEPVKLRGKRGPLHLNSWNIEKVSSRCSSKSWKVLHKCRRQWQKPITI